MKHLLVLFTICSLSGHSFGQTNLQLKYFLENNTSDLSNTHNFYVNGSETEIKSYCKSNSIPIYGQYRNFIKLRMNKSQAGLMASQDFVKTIRFSNFKGTLLNDSTRVINNVDSILNGHPDLLQAYTGKNVLIGVIDGGIDQNHGDFQFPDGSTRILKMWRQHASFSPTQTPAKFGYGREYDSTDINSGLNVGGQYIDHACTVAGAAAGNANANGNHKGMAPDSDLIIVSSDFNQSNWKSTVADAVEYIIDVADSLNRPVVINASLGDYLGSHDGLDLDALRIDSLLLAKPGRIMAAAAGNSGALGKYHLKTTVSNDTSFTWFNHNNSTALGFAGAFLEIWGDTANLSQVDFAIACDKVSPNYERRGIGQFQNLSSNLGNIVEDTIWNGSNNLATIQYYMELRGGQYMLQIAIPEPDSSQYKYALLSTGLGEFDLWSAAWLGLNDMPTAVPDSTQFPLIVNYVQPDSLSTIVDSWACSPQVATVGNYYSRLSYLSYANTIETVPGTQHELSISSSKGPTRTGLIKPDVAATGDMALSACGLSTLAYNQVNDPTKLDIDGLHVRNGGTSMASPIVAGIAALMLEKCPNTTNLEFISALHSSSESDAYTGALPNNAFGYGKVNGVNALKHSNFSPTISGNDYFCPGDSAMLSSSMHDSIIWSTSSTNLNIYIDSTQAVWVEAYNNFGCKGVSDTVHVYEAPLPTPPSIIQIANGLTSDPAFSYQWYYNGSPLIGENGQQHIAQNSGYYAVEIENQFGCSVISDSIWVSLTNINLFNKSDVLIYPNPAHDLVNIELDGGFELILYNSLGKKIIQKQATDKGQLNISTLPKAIYLIYVKKGSKMWTYRLLKE